MSQIRENEKFAMPPTITSNVRDMFAKQLKKKNLTPLHLWLLLRYQNIYRKVIMVTLPIKPNDKTFTKGHYGNSAYKTK